MNGSTGRTPDAPGWTGAGAVAVLLVTMTIIGGASVVVAADGASVSANPDTAGEQSTHTVTMTVGPDAAGSSLDHLTVDYSAGADPADVSDVGVSDLARFGVDRDGDGRIDDSAMGDSVSVSASNDGHTLTIQNSSGPTNLAEGDVVIAEFADVRNPETAGEYEVQLGLNGAETVTATYQVSTAATATESAAPTTTPTETAKPTGTSTTTDTATDTTTDTATDTPTDSTNDAATDATTDTHATTSDTATETASPDTATADSGAATATPEPSESLATGTSDTTEEAEAPAEASTGKVRQQLTVAGTAQGFGPERATFVLTASMVAGVIWLVTVRPPS